MKYIIIIISLIISFEGNSQYDVSLGGGIDFISQSGFEDKAVSNLEFIVQKKIGIAKIGIGYRLTNNSYLHGSNSNVFVVEDNIQIFLDERGRINSKELFLSAEYSIKSFILSTSIGIVRPSVVTRIEHLVKMNGNAESIEFLEYEKEYVSNAFSRTSLGLGYDIRILDKLSIRPALKLFFDLKPKIRSWDLDFFENYESEYKELEGVQVFNSNSKSLIHENKYMFF